MHRVLVIGGGKIGSLIATLLANSNAYQVSLADIQIDSPHLQRLKENTKNLELVNLDAQQPKSIADYLQKNPVQTIVSSLPYYCKH